MLAKRESEARSSVSAVLDGEKEARSKLNAARRIVIKLGTSTVTDAEGGVCAKRVEDRTSAIDGGGFQQLGPLFELPANYGKTAGIWSAADCE